MNICSLTKIPIKVPVISKSSGYVYDRESITDHIKKNGTCPVTGCKIELSDLVEIMPQETIIQNNFTEQSIPDILNMINTEYTCLSEKLTWNKAELERLNKDLILTLNQQESAYILIERLIKEKEEAQANLEKMEGLLKSKKESLYELDEDDLNEEFELGGIPEELKNKLNEVSKQLHADRKSKKNSSNLGFKDYVLKNPITIIRVVDKEEIIGFDVLVIDEVEYISYDTNALNVKVILGIDQTEVFNLKLRECKGGFKSKLFNLNSNIGLSVTMQNQVIYYEYSFDKKSLNEIYKVDIHKGKIIGFYSHSLSDYSIVVAENGQYSFHNALKRVALSLVDVKEDSNIKIFSAGLHPDNMILGFGNQDGSVSMFNLIEEKLLQSFAAHTEPVTNICFSNNGYLMATASKGENKINVWDLRKSVVLRSYSLFDTHTINNIEFDNSGSCLIVSTSKDLRIYNTKSSTASSTILESQLEIRTAKLIENSKSLLFSDTKQISRIQFSSN